MAAVAAGQREIGEQLGDALVEHRAVVAAGLVAEGAGQPDFCRRRSKQRHTAGCPAVEVRILYPFHPRSGEDVAVVGAKRHAGAVHFIIRQPDRTLALLPAWMTDASRGAQALVASSAASGRAAGGSARACRRAHGLMQRGDHPVAREPAMRRARRNQRDLFDETPQVAELRPDLRQQAGAAAAGSAGGGGRRATAPDRISGSRRRGGR